MYERAHAGAHTLDGQYSVGIAPVAPQGLRLPNEDGLIVAVDTETSGLHVDDGARLSVVSISYRTGTGRIISRAFAFDQGELDKDDLPKAYRKGRVVGQASLFDGGTDSDVAPNLGPAEWDELLAWLQRQWLVFHHAKFDLHMFRVGHRVWGRGVDLLGRFVWDTQVIAPICWPAEKTGLKETAARLWGEQERETERALRLWLSKNGQRYDLAPWRLIGKYAEHDTELTLRLFDAERAALTASQRMLVWQEIELAKTLYLMETRGIGWDVAGARGACATIHKAKEALDFGPLGEPTVEKMKDYWYRICGLTPSKRTAKTNKPSIDKEVVRGLVQTGAPYAKEYQEWVKLERGLSMWYLGWTKMVGSDGRLRPVFHQTKGAGNETDDTERGTVSGRLAIERVQLHAIPHDYQLAEGVPTVRSLITARRGYRLYELDVSQAEMRVAAGLSRCKALIRGFAEGQDAHDMTTSLVWKIDKSSDLWVVYRPVGKRLNFGMLYGAGEETVERQIVEFTGMQPEPGEVAMWRNDFKSAMPEVIRMSWRVNEEAKRTHQVKLVSGRVRYFQPWENTHKAFNAVIQGGVAEIMKLWMIDVERMWPGRQLLQIHDSLVMEIEEGGEQIAIDAARWGERLFENAFQVSFVIEPKEWH